MSGAIPVLRVSEEHGQWLLASAGSFKESSSASQQAKKGDFQMWTANVEALIREELTAFGPASVDMMCPATASLDKRDSVPVLKENVHPQQSSIPQESLGLQKTGSSLGIVDKCLGKASTPQKRGILTTNWELCNGSISEVKRQKRFHAPVCKQIDAPISSSQTASIKPREFSTEAKVNHGSSSGSLSKYNDKLFRGPRELVPDRALYLKTGNQLHEKGASECLFQTASGRSVSISSAAMNQAAELLRDAENLRSGQHNANDASVSQPKYGAEMGMHRQEKKQSAAWNSVGGQPVNTSYATSNGTRMFTYEGAMTGRGLLDDIQMQSESDANNIESAHQECTASMFQTANGCTVSFSANAMKQAATLFGRHSSPNLKDQEVNSWMEHTPFQFVDHKHFDGLHHRISMQHAIKDASGGSVIKDASGELVSCSKAAINSRVGDQLSRISMQHAIKDASGGSVIKDDSGELVSCSKAAINSRVAGDTHARKGSHSSTFQTANGRSVSFSAAAINRAKALLRDEDNEGDNEMGQENICSVKQTSRSPLPSKGFSPPFLSTGMVQPAVPFQDGSSHTASLSRVRFMTGRGQSVSVSSSAMKRACDLLGGDLGCTDISAHTCLRSGLEQNSQCLFETASGQLITVSNNSLQRAKKLLGGRVSDSSSGVDRSARRQESILQDKLPCPQELRDLRKGPRSSASGSSLIPKTNAPTRKFAASFKAPRRVQPGLPPAATSRSMELPSQPSKHGFSWLVSLQPLCQKKERKSLQEFFGNKPCYEHEMGLLKTDVRGMTSESARSYRFNITASSEPSPESIGSDEFRQMLIETGAHSQLATKEWVDNHFRWVVWKLACLERSYPVQVAGRMLTIQTVFDELRYRYEREINSAHRSALKRVTEGDAAAGQMMVLCVAAITCVEHHGADIEDNSKSVCVRWQSETNGDEQGPVNTDVVQLEVTDGWYSLNARLDPPLTRQLLAGKIFVGQKLRVCGAVLLGGTSPMPPLEAFDVMKLALHINGTRRAHWSDRLGFCKNIPMPLAFHCIKHDGGLVPRTIIGIRRIYPILYYERLANCGPITRSARAEEWAARHHDERRRQVAEETVLRTERECVELPLDKDTEEGARLFGLLESSAEPELLMADMTAAQHAAFTCYRMNREAARQALVEKRVSKALGEARLDARDVTPFLRLSVTGLRSISNDSTSGQWKRTVSTRGGTITIWHVGEEQVNFLKEGAVYCVSDLNPTFGKSAQSRHTELQLRATKSTTWQPLPKVSFSSFVPRQPLEISALGSVPFRSEFDVAVLVLHVGKPYMSGMQRRQWLFVSDGSLEKGFSSDSKDRVSLLVVDVLTSTEAFLPLEASLEGCVIGYCNLVKRHRDQMNCLWVAEAVEISMFSSNLSGSYFSHLKAAAEEVMKWTKASQVLITELQRRIHSVVAGDLSNA